MNRLGVGKKGIRRIFFSHLSIDSTLESELTPAGLSLTFSPSKISSSILYFFPKVFATSTSALVLHIMYTGISFEKRSTPFMYSNATNSRKIMQNISIIASASELLIKNIGEMHAVTPRAIRC